MEGVSRLIMDGEYEFGVSDSQGARCDSRSTFVECGKHDYGSKVNAQFHLEILRLGINFDSLFRQ